MRCRKAITALLFPARSASAIAQDKDDAPSRYLPTPAVEYPVGVRSLRDLAFGELLSATSAQP